MKESIQNKEQNKPAGETNFCRSFLGKSVKRYELIAAFAILFFGILHYVSPFIVFRHENLLKDVRAVATESNAASASIPAENPPLSASVVKNPLVTVPVEPNLKISPARTALKKKDSPRESRAERLRRAERILTGV